MKITELREENIKRIRVFNIKPDGSLIIIKGRNGQGKSSALDGIAYALGGERLQPPEVVRRGESGGMVEITTDDGLVIRRTWTLVGKKDGEKDVTTEMSRLEVRSADGAVYRSPQTMLDKLLGKMSFDPVSFMRLEPGLQADTLKKLVGLDFKELDGRRDKAYEARTRVNKDGKDLRARVDAMPPKAGAERVDVTALLVERRKLGEAEKAQAAVRRAASDKQQEVETAHQEIVSLETEILDLEHQLGLKREELKLAQAALAAQKDSFDAAQRAAAELKPLDPEVAAIDEKIAGAEAVNASVRADEVRAKGEADLDVLRKQSSDLTKEIEAVDTEKARQLAEAKFPVSGLSFNAAGVLFNGLPLEQASSAEQLRVSLAMGLALNPKLKVLLIRDGSLLDDDSLQLIAEMAAAADAQVFVERVSNEKGGVGVVIEDGLVVPP